jgi:hypothetical protein
MKERRARAAATEEGGVVAAAVSACGTAGLDADAGVDTSVGDVQANRLSRA